MVELVGSLTTWMYKLTRMGVDWKLLIPTNVKNDHGPGAQRAESEGDAR